MPRSLLSVNTMFQMSIPRPDDDGHSRCRGRELIPERSIVWSVDDQCGRSSINVRHLANPSVHDSAGPSRWSQGSLAGKKWEFIEKAGS